MPADRSGGTALVTRAMILSLYEKKPKLDQGERIKKL